MKDDCLQLAPPDFLKSILTQIEEKKDLSISTESFLAYTTYHSIWENDEYDSIFYLIYDYIDERIPRDVYNLFDLREDIKKYI